MSEAKATADRMRIVKVEQRLDCQPYRVYRAWSSPDALTTRELHARSFAPGQDTTVVSRRSYQKNHNTRTEKRRKGLDKNFSG